MTRRSPLAALSALLLAACPGFQLDSDVGHFEIQVAQTEGDPLPRVRSSELLHLRNDTPFLEGTVLCGRLDIDEGTPAGLEDAWWLDCYDVGLTNAEAEADSEGNTCWTLSAGDVVLDFVRAANCPHVDRATLDDDVLRLTAVEAASVTPELLPWPEFGAWEHLVDEDGAPFPDSLTESLPSPLRVAEGEIVQLEAGLRVAGSVRPVAFTQDAARVRYEVVEGSPPTRFGTSAEPEAGEDGAHTLTIRMSRGATIRVFLEIGEDSFDLGEVVAVARSEAATIEIDVAFQSQTDTVRVPAGARAVVLDADGDRIYGVPVRWSADPVELSLNLGDGLGSADPTLMGLDYVRIEDSCRPPSERGGEFTTTLQAQTGSLTATKSVTWTHPGEDDADAGWTKPSNCAPQGCSCSSTGLPASGGGLAVLFALMGTRRRERPSSTTARTGRHSQWRMNPYSGRSGLR